MKCSDNEQLLRVYYCFFSQCASDSTAAEVGKRAMIMTKMILIFVLLASTREQNDKDHYGTDAYEVEAAFVEMTR